MNLERAIFASVAAVGTASCAIALGVSGPHAATSIAAGAAIALLDLWSLRGIVRVIVSAASQSGDEKKSAALGVFLGPKLIALLALVWILLSRHLVSAGPFAIGFAALPIGVAIGALVCEKPDR
jgi:hypothetical protein